MTVDPLKALIGLGNPEGRYSGNRHNIGFLILDRIAKEAGCAVRDAARHVRYCRLQLWGCDTLLVKPQTFMNRSGDAVREVCERWVVRLDDLLIVYDDFALPLGRIRLRPAGSAAGHRGMESIIAGLATDRIPRLRFGIGAPAGIGPADFVLSDFAPDELAAAQPAIERTLDALRCAWQEGMAKAMSLYNREPDPEG